MLQKSTDYDVSPISYSKLDTAQRRDAAIKKILKQPNCNYYLKDFHGGGKIRSLVCYNDKIVVEKKRKNQRFKVWFERKNQRFKVWCEEF